MRGYASRRSSSDASGCSIAVASGWEAAAAEPRSREALDRRGIGARYLLYPARLWPHKDHVTLLRSLAELNGGGGEPFELVLVGADHDGQQAHLEGVASELGVRDAVHFVGFVELDELVAFYQHAHALVYPSRFSTENLPPLQYVERNVATTDAGFVSRHIVIITREDGGSVRLPVCVVANVSDGQVTHLYEYFDSATQSQTGIAVGD